MKTALIEGVELISIKTKSLQDLDNEMNSNLNKMQLNELNSNRSVFNARNEDFELAQPPDNEKEEEEEEEEEENDDEHYQSSVHYVTMNKSPNGACGFHLTRTKWDPYPWVTAVDNFTPAAKSHLKAGDCVLEVNGCDVLGLRITEIAKLIKAAQHQVTLLLWRSNCNNNCNKESLCAAPMPRSLQRLSLVVQMILSLIECPVCLDTITPPAMQCQNGHLLCVNCRIRAENCPVCRDRYFPRPALIAEQIQSAIASAFNLCRNEDKVRQKIFGRHNRQRQMVKTTLQCLRQKQQQKQHQAVHKSLTADTQTKDIGATTTTATNNTAVATSRTTTTINRKCDRKVTDKIFKCARCSSNDNKTTSNKFFTKAYSLENLTNGCNNSATITKTKTNNNFSTCHTTITSAVSQHELLQQQYQQEISSQKQFSEQRAVLKDFGPRLQQQTSSSIANTNQFNDLSSNVARNHHYSLTYKPNLNAIEIDLSINSKLCCKQVLNNKMQRATLSADKDLTRTKENITCLLESLDKHNKTAWPPVVCETSYATIPRAIRLKENYYKKQALCQNDALQAGKETETNSLKSHSSSMTSLDLSLTTPSNLCCCNLNGSTSASSSSSAASNCQSSLSASPSPSISSPFPLSAAN